MMLLKTAGIGWAQKKKMIVDGAVGMVEMASSQQKVVNWMKKANGFKSSCRVLRGNKRYAAYYGWFVIMADQAKIRLRLSKWP